VTIAEKLLPEFDHEMKTTRALLERVPEDRAGWAPHEKSTTLGKLALHVANLPALGALMLRTTELDPTSETMKSVAAPAFTTTADLLAHFDRVAAAGREALSNAPDAQLLETWTFHRGERVMFKAPRAAAWRTFVMNHHIHHRGQLTVYLRLNDVPLPSVYGPTADLPL
jgi:uncharacterized damage-inducible protein DinB